MSPVGNSLLSVFLLCRIFSFGAISIYRLAPIRIYPSAVRSTEIFQLFQLRTRWAAGLGGLMKKCNEESCSESSDLSTLLFSEFVDDATMTFYLILSEKSALFGQLCDSREAPWRRRRFLVLINILRSGKNLATFIFAPPQL